MVVSTDGMGQAYIYIQQGSCIGWWVGTAFGVSRFGDTPAYLGFCFLFFFPLLSSTHLDGWDGMECPVARWPG